MGAKSENVLYNVSPWKIEARDRNNHDGKKIWVLYEDVEVYSFDERGFRKRGNAELPDEIKQLVLDAWETITAK